MFRCGKTSQICYFVTTSAIFEGSVEKRSFHINHHFGLISITIRWLYLYWITLSVTQAALAKGPVRATSPCPVLCTEGNQNTRRKLAVLGRVKLDHTFPTCDQGNFNQITEPESSPSHSGERHMNYQCATSTLDKHPGFEMVV